MASWQHSTRYRFYDLRGLIQRAKAPAGLRWCPSDVTCLPRCSSRRSMIGENAEVGLVCRLAQDQEPASAWRRPANG